MSAQPSAHEPYSTLRPLRPIDVQNAVGGIGRPPRGRTAANHTTVAAVDITAFGDRRRDDEAQLHLRHAMYGCLTRAFGMTRLPWWESYREDRGDGALIITPPEVPAEALMDPLAHHLNAELRHRNRLASDIARLRLRLAVHIGQVHHDDNGVAGHALVHLFRLLDAVAFKRVLTASDADVGMIVSDRLYQDATHSGTGFVDPDAYQSRRIRCKGTRATGWIWLPPTRR